jgi:tetratricopeptide (TPR) repeat protein
MTTHQNAVSLFFSYAHEDEPLLRQLETHLSLLKRQGLISIWYDRQIVAGTNWAKVIDERLEQASIILLLVSPDFLASEYCYQVEMKRALERHETGQARVIPIAIRPADWKGAPFAHLQALPTDAKAITTWSNQDEALIHVGAGIRRAIEDLSLLPASTLRTALPAIWNIPYPRNSFFLGREDVLTRLHSQLQTGQVTGLSQPPQAISGLGGIGKTQIAVEYSYRYHPEYQAVLWARSDTRETLVSDYVTIAQLLHLPQRDAQDQSVIIDAVLQWLKTHGQWLLILDNADDLALIGKFLPQAFGGHIILTTRAQAMGRLAQRIEVDTMELDVGALLLLRRAGLVAPDALLEEALPFDVATAKEVTEELGGLPLALDQAGAYIEETSCSLLDYRSLYRARRAEMLNVRGGQVADHPASVATTWSLSFQQVEQGNPAAAELLRFCAFLHPDAIPEEIITAGAEHLGALLHLVARDPLALNQAIAVLRAYSLVHRDVATKTLNVHRLVQAVLMDRMDAETHRLLAQRTVLAVSEAFPNVEFTSWERCERCLPSALACATLIEQYHFTFSAAARLLSNTGGYLRGHAHYDEAEVLLQRALRIYENIAEPTYPAYGITLNELAEIYKAQSKYAQAVPLLQYALDLSEEQPEPDHLHMVTILVNLARNYREQGKYAEAEPLLQRALAIYEQALRPDHPFTATALKNYASLLRKMQRTREAATLEQRASLIQAKSS